MDNNITFSAEHYRTKEKKVFEWKEISVVITLHSADLLWINGLPYRMSSVRISETGRAMAKKGKRQVK